MRLIYGDLDLTDYPYALEFGMDVGAPENVSQALAFLLQDGEIELSSRSSNRTLAFNVIIEGADLAEMATAEQALILETEKALNQVTVDPEDFGPASVYDTFRGQVTLQRDDNGEIGRLRRYQVTVRAYPFVKSDTETSLPGIAGGTTTTNVDTMGATTGWSGSVNGTTATVANVVGPPTTNGVTQASAVGIVSIKMSKAIAATTTSLKYLIVDWQSAGSSTSLDDLGLAATGDGVVLTKVAEAASPLTAGFTRTWFYVAAASLGTIEFSSVSVTQTASRTRYLRLDNLAISDVNPGIGTQRQQIRTVSVLGSARTQASLAIESTTAALGDALVYVYPNDDTTTGYVPALRQFRTAGNTVTTDSATLSGSVESITGTGTTFQIPVGQLPAGQYVLLARLAGAAAGTPTITWTTRTVLGGTNLAPTVTGSRAIVTAVAYQTYTLARFQLPTVDLGDSSSAVQSLNLTASSTCTIDTAWLFNTTLGQLIQVTCGTGAGAVGGAARRLFIEPATTSLPRPTVRIGHSADRSDAYNPGSAVLSWQVPQFRPPTANVFTATSNATDSVVTLRYFPRWHTSAAS